MYEASGLSVTELIIAMARRGSVLSETAVRNWLSEENGSVPGLLHFLNLLMVLCDEGDAQRSAAKMLLERFYAQEAA